MMSEPIAGHIVQRCLRVHENTLDHWHKIGFLRLASETRRCNHETDLDAFLDANSYNFEVTPTFADLVAGKVKLLTPQEARDLLKGTGNITRFVWAGHVAAVRFVRDMRYSEQSVKSYIAARAERDAAAQGGLTGEQVAHILGVSIGTVRAFYRQEKLVKVVKNRYTKESVLALLGELLPAHLHPQDWLEDRLASKRPLLSIARAVPSQEDRGRILNWLQSGMLHYITPSLPHHPLISPDSLLAYIQRTEQPLTLQNVARLFGTTVENVKNWDKEKPGWRKCHVHEHRDSNLYRDCAIFVLQQYMSPGAPAIAWYKARMGQNWLTIGLAETAEIFGVSTEVVVERINAGKLRALTMPDGELRFSKVAVLDIKYRRPRKAAQSD